MKSRRGTKDSDKASAGCYGEAAVTCPAQIGGGGGGGGDGRGSLGSEGGCSPDDGAAAKCSWNLI